MTAPDLIVLPPSVDIGAVPQLIDELRGHPVGMLRIDASQVQHLGAMGLQVLLAASAHAGETGRLMRLVNPSAAFICAVDLFGATTHLSTHVVEEPATRCE